MKEAAFSTVIELTTALAGRRISSRELLDVFIDRYQRYNPAVNAIVVPNFEPAYARANAADAARARGEHWGPLHGLPMTVKESFGFAGLPCTAGAPALATHVPRTHADVVHALSAAGAVIFGKTNVPLMTRDVQSYNDLYGQTGNPWDLTLVPGGSSGGAAAALAAGLTPAEVGSDIAGSIRTPAHFCGVYGHKPSHGLVSMKGHVPPVPGTFSGDYWPDGDLAVAGPMARCAKDLDLMLDILAGPKAPERRAYKLALPPPRRAKLSDFRIGLWLDCAAAPVDAQVGDAIDGFIGALRAAGARMVDARPAIDFGASHALYCQLLNANSSTALPDELHGMVERRLPWLDKHDTSFRAQYVRGTAITHRNWKKLDQQRFALRQQWADFFRDFDVLLCPAAPLTAFPHDHGELLDRTLRVNGRQQDYFDTLLAWPGLASVAYLPATAIPIGCAANGMPVGLQVLGPFLEDRTPLHFAQLAAEVVGPGPVPPNYR